MTLIGPILDDRTYAQLSDELVKRIPVYAPEWTDHNESDPGIALLELFAHLGESLLFRFNQIPDATKVAFLRLLGVQPRPAQRARTLLALSTERPGGPAGAAGQGGPGRIGRLPDPGRGVRLADGGPRRAQAGAGSAGYRRRRPGRAAAAGRRRCPAAGVCPSAGAAGRVPVLRGGDARPGPDGGRRRPAGHQRSGRPHAVGGAARGQRPAARAAGRVAGATRPCSSASRSPRPSIPTVRAGAGRPRREHDPRLRAICGRTPGASTRRRCSGSSGTGRWVRRRRRRPATAAVPPFTTLTVPGDTTRGLTTTGVLKLADAAAAAPAEPGRGTLRRPGRPRRRIDDAEDRQPGSSAGCGPVGPADSRRPDPPRPLGRGQRRAAVQPRTASPELLGTGTGDPGQAYRLTQPSVLPGRPSQLEVEESDGWHPWTEVDSFSATRRPRPRTTPWTTSPGR